MTVEVISVTAHELMFATHQHVACEIAMEVIDDGCVDVLRFNVEVEDITGDIGTVVFGSDSDIDFVDFGSDSGSGDIGNVVFGSGSGSGSGSGGGGGSGNGGGGSRVGNGDGDGGGDGSCIGGGGGGAAAVAAAAAAAAVAYCLMLPPSHALPFSSLNTPYPPWTRTRPSATCVQQE